MKKYVLPSLSFVFALTSLALVLADENPATNAALAKIGTWDGKTASAELQGPYEDPLQQEIRFGQRSYYLAPWRSYMDTWPAAQYIQALGINFNVNDREAEPVAAVLEAAGITAARVEVGWGGFSYDDPTKLTDNGKRLMAQLQALKRHNIRPLILLNANSGQPVPVKFFKGKLMADAPANAREVVLENIPDIRPGYTGFQGLVTRRQGFPFITNFDTTTGKATLSAPLPKALPAGEVRLVNLKYHPLGGSVFQDGKPNPLAKETLDGWLAYAGAVSRYVKAGLGTEGAADAGFDIEVWNEYTFGSEFLNEKNYYQPARTFKEPLIYEKHGRRQTGPEVLLPMTVDYFNDPANKTPGVRVISGFANQRPWDNGAQMWPGQAGFSRHYYTGLEVPGKYLASPQTEKSNSGPINALGTADGKPDGKDWHTVLPGSFFVPVHVSQGPETWHYGYKTEFITRDVQPFPGPFKGHFRYAHPGNGKPGLVWQTEVHTYLRPWGNWLLEQAKVPRTEPRYHQLMQHFNAKTLLRTYLFMASKGLGPQMVFAAKGSDDSFGTLSENFYKALAANKHVLTPEIQAEVGPAMTAIGRVTQVMKTGKPMAEARPLSVEKLVEYKPRLVFAGDGTPQHPNRYNRDDFACMPFQLDAGRFAVGYYIVTRNMAHEWDKTKDLLDAARYDMPAQEFDLTLGNIRGAGARVSSMDPLTGKESPVTVVASTPTSLTVKLAVTDSPRLLLIDEAKPGPLIQNPQLQMNGNSASLSFETNVAAPVQVTWGRIPERKDGGSKTLAAGQAHTVTIPNLPAGTGVQVSVVSDGLNARWPRWGHDVAGVGRFTAPLRASTTSTTEAAPFDWRVPVLPDVKRPSNYTAQLPPGAKWTEADGERQVYFGERGKGVTVRMKIVQVPLSDVTSVLPEVSSLDRAFISRKDWGGVPAWDVDIVLAAAAHPGVEETHQRYRITPMANGVLVASYTGSRAGWRGKNLEQARELVEGVKFEF